MLFRKIILKALFSLIILVIIFSSVFSYEYLYRKTKDDVRVIIPKGYTIRETARLLDSKKVIDTPYVFLIASKIYHILGNNIIAGEYIFTSGTNMYQLMNILHNGKVTVHKITIPEGITVSQVLNILKNSQGIIDTEIKIDEFPEGSLLPDTYYYMYYTTDHELLTRMKNSMEKLLDDIWQMRNKEKTSVMTTKEEALILASIVQKEAILSNEKPIIAKVYLNRLSSGMLLQADPTVIYGISKWENFNRKLYYNDLKKESEYNTYLNKGLPPTPICNPGKDTILAVLNPTDTKALYFVANKQGGHHFADDFKQHKENILMVRKRKK